MGGGGCHKEGNREHTFGCGAGLAGNGASCPQLPQRIAEDSGEVIGIGGLVAARSQALLLQALQWRVGCQNGLPMQWPHAFMLAMLGLVYDLTTRVQHLPIDLHTVFANLMSCTGNETAQLSLQPTDIPSTAY